MEFGGGLSRYYTSPAEQNECRDIVEVPGGSEWKIRRLEESSGEFCWKYPGSSVIVNYHFKRLQNSMSEDVQIEESENQRMFYGKVSHFMSPLEISLQPKYLSSVRKSIMNQLNAEYQCAITVPKRFADEEMFVPVACAVEEFGIWYRGRMAQISGSEHVVVELVDFGTQILVARHQILPLARRFGRVPPLCLKCRVDGLSVNDLEITDLHEFKNIVEDCNALFRVEIKSIEEPYLIDLYHPTIAGLNVCEKFFAPPEDVAKLERIERSWEAHCKKMNEEFDEDEDFEEEHGDGDYFPLNRATSSSLEDVVPRHLGLDRKFVKRLPKCQRASRFEQDSLQVEHVENSQLIYLQYSWQFKKREELEDVLRATWNRLPSVPAHLRVNDQICVVRNPRLQMICRAIITDADTVLLVDYGKFVRCPIGGDLRMLPAEGIMMEEPMITIVSLKHGINTQWPHHSETEFLRCKLPRGTLVRFRWDKRSKTTPLKGQLTIIGQRDTLNDQMCKFLKMHKIDGTCRELDIYRPRANHVLPCDTHVYRSTCHAQYTKGSREFVWI